jgi:hypothetical protein
VAKKPGNTANSRCEWSNEYADIVLSESTSTSIFDTRQDQFFPTSNATQIHSSMRFAGGKVRLFAPDEVLWEVDDRQLPVGLFWTGPS